MKAITVGRRPSAGKLEGRHVLAILLGFFAVVLTVNGYFLYAALSTHTGIVANEPYRKGLAYNERIVAEVEQNRLGWHDGLALGRDGRLVLSMIDGSGAAVRGLAATAIVGRPSTERFDHKVKLAEQADGRYAADLGKLDGGAWIVSVEAGDGSAAAPVYRLRRRLWLNP
jgi:nitrogen fixation protein FixH